MKRIVMCLMAVVTACTVMADTATVGGIEWNYTVIDGSYIQLNGIASTSLPSTELTTPTTLAGKTVKTIGPSCFSGRDTIATITISEGVTYLCGSAFSSCSALKTVSLPSTLETINGLFGSRPTSILFPNGSNHFKMVNNFLCSADGKSLYVLLAGLTDVVFPSGITEVPAGICYNYTALVSVVIPEGVTKINSGNGSFQDCPNLMEVKLPSTLTEIGSAAFSGCGSLADVFLPEGLMGIGWEGFWHAGRAGLKKIMIPSSVDSIAGWAFGGALSHIEFRGGNTQLSDNAFAWCSSLNVIFHAAPPTNIDGSELREHAATVMYPKTYAEQYAQMFDESKFAGYVDENACSVLVKSAKMRAEDPTIMDVTFRVTCDQQKVKVRAVAYRDGVRDLDHAVRIKSVADGFGTALGDAITANEDHTFAWKVSDDFTNKIAKLSVDVMAVKDSPLTFEFVTIPASGEHAALTIARNRSSEPMWMDAMMWAYADKSAQWTKMVTTSEYNYQNGSSQHRYTTKAVNDAGKEFYSAQSEWILSYNDDGSTRNKVILTMLGYTAATEDELAYAREKTGYSLSNGPYAVKK